MNRENILSIYPDKIQPLIIPLIDTLETITAQINSIRDLPTIATHESDKTLQRTTAAGKLLIRLTQEQNHIITTLLRLAGKQDDDSGELSPLRAYLQAVLKNEEIPKNN